MAERAHRGIATRTEQYDRGRVCDVRSPILKLGQQRHRSGNMRPQPRSNVTGPALLAGVAAGLLLTTGIAMAQECPLAAPLVVKDLQSGFVGQTGTVWTIAPDCSFTVARQTGTKIGDPHKHGRLSPEQRQRLADMIRRSDLAGYPDRLGGAPQPNAHQII